MKKLYLVAALGMCLALAGCGAATNDTTESEDASSTEATSEIGEIIPPSGVVLPRPIPADVPAAMASPENPGTRARCSFQVGDTTYVFTETEDLWLYNQSYINQMETQFMLDVSGYKVAMLPATTEQKQDAGIDTYTKVYEENGVTLWLSPQPDDVKKDKVAEDTRMFLTVYDLNYEVTFFPELVNKNVVKLVDLYKSLGQMGTAIQPTAEGETLTDALTGLREVPVIDEYRMAYREGIPYSGFIFCSPLSGNSDHDEVSIYMSIEIQDWDNFATLHVEKTPDFVDRLEDTGEALDEAHKIYADYSGELKYYILGADDTCIYLDGFPGASSTGSKDSFTTKEAAYIFQLVLEKGEPVAEPEPQ